jgi:4-hydroxythreonine-4-phosphate dehydrogenase
VHRLLIIADDLTGAADCGITCVAAGLDTVVVLKGDEPIPSTDVVSVDAATRRLSSPDAAEQTARLTRRYLGPETRILFKKLDSTLRGHVAQEIAAVLSVSRALHGAHGIAIVAPAFPAMGRTTVGGRQFVRGVPVETTEIWHREALKASAYLPGRLGEHGLRATHIDLHTVRSEKRLSDALAGAKAQHDAVVCDAETDEDLRAIVRAGITLQTSIVWAGSAALAAQLPQAMGIGREPWKSILPSPVHRPTLSTNGPLLFVIGSPSQASREQIPRLVADRDIESVSVPLAALRHGVHSATWAEQTRRLERAFSTGRDIVLSLDMEGRSGVEGRSNANGQFGGDSQSSAHEDATLSPALAALVSPYVTRCGGLVLTGGETARSVLDRLGVATLRLVGEVEPGIPLSVATVVTPAGSLCLPVITKAGAFGSPHSLLRCHDAIRTLRTLT